MPAVSGSADGTGNAARFNAPAGVAVDTAGNVYVADTLNFTIRKVTSAGVVTTLAGLAGSYGSADGTGSAARFAFNGPSGIAVDSTGNVCVADTGNCTIRKVTPGGVVTTLAGLAGNRGSADGTGSDARFYWPYGVAVDTAGNVYVADSANFTIRKMTPFGVVTTLAGLAGSSGSADGTGSAARFGGPFGVAVDTAGNVYIADSASFTIRKMTPFGVVTTLAGLAGSSGSADGTGSAARFGGAWPGPDGVAVDGAGNVYVADYCNHTMRKVTPAGVVTTLAGLAGHGGSADGTGGAAQFNGPAGVALDSAGTVYVADWYNDRITKGTPPPHAATATATVVNGFVVGADITDGGRGYTNTPAVRVIGGGGSGAQAVAVVGNGLVLAVNVLNAGSGYTSTPVIVIAPPFIPQPTMSITALPVMAEPGTQLLELGLGSLSPYDNYQLEFTPVVGGAWSSFGVPFAPPSATSTNDVIVSGNAGFLRVRYVP